MQRTDLDIDSEAGRAGTYADNRVGELSLDWDAEQVPLTWMRALTVGLFFKISTLTN